MEVTPELVEKLARLSRLRFNADEQEAIRRDLEGMIGLVEKLNELPLEGVSPLLHLNDTVNAWREDTVEGMAERPDAFRNAPRQDGEFFLVPRVIQPPPTGHR